MISSWWRWTTSQSAWETLPCEKPKRDSRRKSTASALALRYAGETNMDGTTYDLFRIPDDGVTGRDLFNADAPLYLMMAVCDSDESIWFLYRPKWRKANTVKKVFNKEMLL